MYYELGLKLKKSERERERESGDTYRFRGMKSESGEAWSIYSCVDPSNRSPYC